ncbi:zinc finger protein swm [Plutella xylostella]|uniref:zinc finger protein swm n=1 Tax=Plutella xylostella TaxID=51655 RepID=UPI0020329482|nr:zinc finger protein swm [Plutella xylostella]
MIIENPDTFKSWLTSILEPLCDADPAALAKYVYALVKKDKPLQELREGMLDQLDVFLQQETKPFVDMLFKSLESQEYLTAVIPEPAPEPPAPPAPVIEGAKEPNEPEPTPPSNGVAPAPALPPAPAPAPAAPAAPRQRVVVSRGDKVPPRPRIQEQTLVKVMPLTELLEEPVDQPPRRRDRRGDSLRDIIDRRRRRSRSWERRGRRRHASPDDPRRHDKRRPPSRSPSPRRYRNRSPPPPAMLDRPPSRSRSRSPIPVRDRLHDRDRRVAERDRMSRDREHRDRTQRSRDRDHSRDRSRERSRGSAGTPTREERPHAGYKRRCRDFDGTWEYEGMIGKHIMMIFGPGRITTRAESVSRGSAGTPSREERPHAGYKRRCRDFDEKGYCMRGDLCQWDHGADPLVLEDASFPVPRVPEYNPLAPDIWGGGAPMPFPPHHLPPPPRALIPIRIREAAPPPMMAQLPPAPMPLRPPAPKKNFEYNRLGPRPPLSGNGANCSLEVKKVPRGLNDITHLNNHFSKFGKIVNIQVCFEGDPEGALITFSTHTEANVAYKSTEAVLNNRFIKVLWHNPESKQENVPPAAPAQPNAASHNKVLINKDNMKASQQLRTANADKLAKEQQQQQQQTAQTNGVTAPDAAEPRDKSRLVMEMHKRAQTLLETQLRQQTTLIHKLEQGNVTEQQKAALMEAINSSQEGIEKLRKELVAYNKMMMQVQEETVARSFRRLQLAQANAKRPKTREEAQKEILDAELDMFTKQQEGQDVTELMKKVAELRRQMALQFPPHPAARRPHASYRIVKKKLRGGRFNTSTRFVRNNVAPPNPAAPKVFVNQSVDHRPRALLVSGFEADELDGLIKHFSQYGEVTGKEVNLAVPELILQFKLRAQAEAAARGRNYNERTLSITWVTNNKPITPIAAPPAAAPAQNGTTPAEATTEVAEQPPSESMSEDALLRFDEEEEDEEEDRSWRR